MEFLLHADDVADIVLLQYDTNYFYKRTKLLRTFQYRKGHNVLEINYSSLDSKPNYIFLIVLVNVSVSVLHMFLLYEASIVL